MNSSCPHTIYTVKSELYTFQSEITGIIKIKNMQKCISSNKNQLGKYILDSILYSCQETKAKYVKIVLQKKQNIMYETNSFSFLIVYYITNYKHF